jgi:hypothetical protein
MRVFVLLSWTENNQSKSSSYVLSMYPTPHPDPKFNWELAYEEYRISKGDKPKFNTKLGAPVVIPEEAYLQDAVFNDDYADTGMRLL